MGQTYVGWDNREYEDAGYDHDGDRLVWAAIMPGGRGDRTKRVYITDADLDLADYVGDVVGCEQCNDCGSPATRVRPHPRVKGLYEMVCERPDGDEYTDFDPCGARYAIDRIPASRINT